MGGEGRERDLPVLVAAMPKKICIWGSMKNSCKDNVKKKIMGLRPVSALMGMTGISPSLGEICTKAGKNYQHDVVDRLLLHLPLMMNEIDIEMYADLAVWQFLVPHVPTLSKVESLTCEVTELKGEFNHWGAFQDTLLHIFKELKVKTFLVLHFNVSKTQMEGALGNISRLDECLETEEHLQICQVQYETKTGVLYDEGLRNDDREVDLKWFLCRRAVNLFSLSCAQHEVKI